MNREGPTYVRTYAHVRILVCTTNGRLMTSAERMLVCVCMCVCVCVCVCVCERVCVYHKYASVYVCSGGVYVCTFVHSMDLVYLSISVCN